MDRLGRQDRLGHRLGARQLGIEGEGRDMAQPLHELVMGGAGERPPHRSQRLVPGALVFLSKLRQSGKPSMSWGSGVLRRPLEIGRPGRIAPPV